MNVSSATVAHETNEFKLAGLTEAACRMVKAPRVAESPAALQCKLVQITELHGLDAKSAAQGGRLAVTTNGSGAGTSDTDTNVASAS